MSGRTTSAICYGELLWDFLPDGRKVLGGAPANVAYHLGRLGVDTSLLSRIGSDDLGRETREELRRAGISTRDIQVDATLPTGSASVEIRALGAVTYEFATPAAWDEIEATDVGPVRALIFGTLAQRALRSRTTLRSLLVNIPERIYDVNLRPPYTAISLVVESLSLATFVKLNEDEASFLAEHLHISPEPASFAREIMGRYGPRIVCVTRADRGAWLASPESFIETPGIPIRGCDPVGAGDAFLAALIAGLLSGADWRRTLHRANELGAWVASRPGAMPYPE